MRNGFPMCGLISACFFLVGAIQQVAFSQSNLANSDGKSNHFDVRSYSNGPSAKSVLHLCETVRAELQRGFVSINLIDRRPIPKSESRFAIKSNAKI